MRSPRAFCWLILLLLVVLPACGSRTPQLIGSYPKAASPTYPPPPANLLLVYNAYWELEVSNVDSAAQRAAQIAYDRGGYLASSQAWYQGDEKYATLTLAVPAAQFDSARQALLGLGTLKSESVSGSLVNAGSGANGWNTFSNITLQLRQAPPAFRLPSFPTFGWSPARTFAQAFGVFASMFAFLVDILIWAAVVIGPFVLMGLGLRALLRRVRPRP